MAEVGESFPFSIFGETLSLFLESGTGCKHPYGFWRSKLMSSIVPADASPGEARELPVYSFSWVLALFGTAVGAGILFLPIQVEQSGFWVLLLVSVLIYPTIYLGHRFYALIPSRVADGADFFAAVGRWLPGWGAILLHLLFISWLLLLLIA